MQFLNIFEPNQTMWAGGVTGPPKFCRSVNSTRTGRVDFPHLLLLAPQCFSPSGITEVYSYSCKMLKNYVTITTVDITLIGRLFNFISNSLYAVHIIPYLLGNSLQNLSEIDFEILFSFDGRSI